MHRVEIPLLVVQTPAAESAAHPCWTFSRWAKCLAVVCSACRSCDWCISAACAGNFALTLLPWCALSYLTWRFIDPCREILFSQQGLSAGSVAGEREKRFSGVAEKCWVEKRRECWASWRTEMNKWPALVASLYFMVCPKTKLRKGRKLQIDTNSAANWRGNCLHGMLNWLSEGWIEHLRQKCFYTAFYRFSINTENGS